MLSLWQQRGFGEPLFVADRAPWLLVAAFVLLIVCARGYAAAPRRMRWLSLVAATALVALATSASTIVAVIGVAAVLVSIALLRAREDVAPGVFTAVITGVLLAGAWWIPMTSLARLRATGAPERGVVRDDGTSRVVVAGAPRRSAFSSQRLHALRSLAVDAHGRWRLDAPLVDFLGIRAIGSTANADALPRFFFVRSYVFRGEVADVVRVLRGLRDYRELATVDHVPSKIAHMAGAPLAGATDGATFSTRGATLRPTGPRSMIVESEGWNLLVSNEPWWEGWRVYWNGERLPVVIVNGAFAGTFVPPGGGRIEFRYGPAAWQTGLRASGAGVLLALVFLLWPLRASPRLPFDALKRAAPVMIALALIAYAALLHVRRDDRVGGADSSGYLNQARLWAAGKALAPMPTLARTLQLPPEAVLPLGFVPGPREGTMAPSYPPGVPLQMAALLKLGGESAPFWLARLAAIAGVLLLYRVARDLGMTQGWSTAAAAMLALCPAYVFFAVQPMSDVVATCWTLAALACALRSRETTWWALPAAAAFGVAVLTRPSNALLLPAMVAAIGWRPRALALFAAGGVPFAAVQLAINHHFYGHALASGYGTVQTSIDPAFFSSRFAHYSFYLAVLLSPLVYPGGVVGIFAHRKRALLALWFVPLFVFYCWYEYYEAWWYTRFLLPVVPALIIGATFVLARARHAGVVVAIALVAIFVCEVAAIRRYHVLLDLREETYRKAFTSLPRDATLLTMQHSGALLYYAGRESIRYDSLSPERFAKLAPRLRGRVCAVVERWELGELESRTGVRWPPAPEPNVDDRVLLRCLVQ